MKNISEVIKDINDYYGCEFATESFNKGRNTIYLDIPSVITTSLSEENLNQLYKTENVVNTLKELLPALKFFNSRDIIQKKEEFKGDVQYSSKLDNNKADNELAINAMDNVSYGIKIQNGIDILNSLFQKKYIANSRRGVIFNGAANIQKYPFPETITNEIIKIQSKKDAKQVLQMLLEIPTYEVMQKYLRNRYGEDSDIKINKGIKILNTVFKKKYIRCGKHGIVFGINDLQAYPFPEYIVNEILNITSKEDANKVVQMLLARPEYAICKNYLNTNDDNWQKILNPDTKHVVIKEEDYDKFTPILEYVNKWLISNLYIDSDGRIVYDMKVKLSKNQRKKQRRKSCIEAQVLPNKLVEYFKNISSNEDIMAFLIKLYDFHATNFNRTPSKIFREKIYVESDGFVDDYGLLNVLRNINNRFKIPQVFVANVVHLQDEYIIKDAMIREMLEIQKREDKTQEEKNELILNQIKSLNVINPKEFKFYGSKEMLDLETSILNEALSMVAKYGCMLNAISVQEIRATSTYSKSIDMSINVQKVEELKRLFNGQCFDTMINRYADIIEMSNPLFNVEFKQKNLKSKDNIYNEVITINNIVCMSIENIYRLSKNNVLNIIGYYKEFINTTINNNAQEIIDAVQKKNKCNSEDIEMFRMELITDVYLSKLHYKSETLYYGANSYTLDLFDEELLRQELCDKIKEDIKEHHRTLLEDRIVYWDRELKTKTEAYNIQNIKEYATIVYLVGNERNKGITTYTNILLGSKSEYAANSVYGALKHLKSNKINSMIEELIDLNVLDRANKKASFGRYIAIVKGGYYNENIAAKFQDGKFIGEDVVVNSDKKYVDAKNVVSKISTMEFIKTLKDMDLTVINKNNINVTGLDIKDVQEFADIICEDKRFYNKNWEIISNIIPPLSDQVIMFLKLKSINNNDSLKNIIEIEEKKRKG